MAREAAPEELPAVLAAPPRYQPEAPKLRILPVDEPARLCWRPGERAAWLRAGAGYCWPDEWPALHQRVTQRGDLGGLDGAERPVYLLSGPVEATRPWFIGWSGAGVDRGDLDALRALVARHGLDAVRFVRRNVVGYPELADPIADSTLVPAAVSRLGQPATAPAAWRWLLRHPDSAALGLVPIAASGAMANNDWLWAGEALRGLAAAGHRGTVLAAAQRYGRRCVDLVDTLLAHPVHPLRKRPPRPSWLRAGDLPPILLRDKRSWLPDDAVEVLIDLVARCRAVRAGLPQPDLAEVIDACDPASLSRFATALLDGWLADGADPHEIHVLALAGLLGDDSTVDRLAAALPGWYKGGTVRLRAAVDALAAIGGEPALRALVAVALRSGTGKHRATQLLAVAAAERNTTTDALIDRLAPDLGLPADRTVTVDYGCRTFEVRFDHLLRPVITGPDGKRRASLPKPGARDEAAAMPAYQRFRALQRDVAEFAASQLDRLRAAMLSGHRWTGNGFRHGVLGNPVTRTLADRLLWTIDGTVVFRVAEDGSAADLADTEIAVPDDAVVGVAHPAELGDTLPRWRQVFADYQIQQPFDQLARPTFRLAPGESLADRLAGYAGRTARHPFADGWAGASPATLVTAARPDGRLLRVTFDRDAPQWGVIRSVAVSNPSVLCGPFPDDAVFVSELLLDLERLCGRHDD